MTSATPPLVRRWARHIVALVAGIAALAGALTVRAAGTAQAPATPPAAPAASDAGIFAMKVQGSVHVIVGAGANVVVQVGDLGPIVVDTGTAAKADALLAAIRTLTPRPVRYIVNTHAHADHVGGNERIGAAGLPTSCRGVAQVGAGLGARAEIIAHEETLNRMSAPAGAQAPTPVVAWPTQTFSGARKEFFYNGEAVQVIHLASAHTDGDSVVFFRRSDVLVAGEVYDPTRFPRIDLDKGGSIQGVIDALNRIIGITVPPIPLVWQEGGTVVIGAHGTIGHEADVVDYRDMVTIVRDRIQDLMKKGQTLAQIRQADPVKGYRRRYGADTGPWTTNQFIEAVYKSLGGK
jgi:cyclase